MVLALDVDVVRAMLGCWLDDPVTAGPAARRMSLAMACAHLAAGHDVVMPQLLSRVDFVLELAGLCADVGADLVEVLLDCDAADAAVRFDRRSRTSSRQRHQEAAELARRQPEPMAQVCDGLASVMAARPATRVVASGDGQVDRAYGDLLAVLAGLPVPTSARPSDVARLVELRERAALWLTGRGIRQWEPGEVGPEEIAGQVSAGEWFVVRAPGEGPPVAALRLLWDDEPIWGPRPPDAAYVHGLVVDRSHAGQGLGAALLNWAHLQAVAAGRSVLRLDCVESNADLRDHYRAAGWREVGRRDFAGPWHSAVLLERSLDRGLSGSQM